MTVYRSLFDLYGVEIPEPIEVPSIRPLLVALDLGEKIPAMATVHRDNHNVRSDFYRYIRYTNPSEEICNHEPDPYEVRIWQAIPSSTSANSLFSRIYLR